MEVDCSQPETMLLNEEAVGSDFCSIISYFNRIQQKTLALLVRHLNELS